jgi:hypothetical protein
MAVIKTLDLDRFSIHPKMLDPDHDPYPMNMNPKHWIKEGATKPVISLFQTINCKKCFKI